MNQGGNCNAVNWQVRLTYKQILFYFLCHVFILLYGHKSIAFKINLFNTNLISKQLFYYHVALIAQTTNFNVS